ncbi:MAG: hypothetical protein JXA37_04150 [Chloroflexia bacterium]|nr:hypothetical protein [Chloroflexia bacterium]
MTEERFTVRLTLHTPPLVFSRSELERTAYWKAGGNVEMAATIIRERLEKSSMLLELDYDELEKLRGALFDWLSPSRRRRSVQLEVSGNLAPTQPEGIAEWNEQHRQARSDLESTIRQLQEQLEQTAGDAKRCKKECQSLRDGIYQAAIERDKARADLESERQAFQKGTAAIQEELKEFRQRAQDEQETFNKLLEGLRAERDDLSKEKIKLEEALQAKEDELSQAQQFLRTLEARVEALSAEVASAKEAMAGLQELRTAVQDQKSRLEEIEEQLQGLEKRSQEVTRPTGSSKPPGPAGHFLDG